MNALRRILSLLLAAPLILTAACSGDSKAGDDEQVTLTYAIWDQAQVAAMKQIISEFHAQHPKIDVQVQVTPWESYWTKLQTSITSGTGPDLFWMTMVYAKYYATGGGTAPLDGGIARSTYELVGPAAEAMLANYHLDIAFIGVDGLTPEEGCTTYDEMEAQTDRAFLCRARRSVVIADSSKIGRVTFARISLLSGVSDIVTDRGAHPDQIEAFRRAGVRVTTVGLPGDA